MSLGGKTELTLSPDHVELAYRKVPTLPERVSTNARRSGLASRQASWLVLAISWVCVGGLERISMIVYVNDWKITLGSRCLRCTSCRACQC